MESKKPIEHDRWLDLSERAFRRLEDVIEVTGPDDPKLLHAIKEVMDRAYGRPKEQHEITGKDGKPLFPTREEVESAIKNIAP